MIIGDRYIYLQLQKTGCTHIERLLTEHFGGRRNGPKHDRITSEALASGKRVISSVRSPWDWYVSLWAFGCDGGSAVQRRLTAPPFMRGVMVDAQKRGLRTFVRTAWEETQRATRVSAWRASYTTSSDVVAFRRWLALVHDPAASIDLKDGYDRSPMRAFAGFYTYRFVRMFTGPDASLRSSELGTPAGLAAFMERHWIIDAVIKNERLAEDLIVALESCGVAVGEDVRSVIRGAPRTNTSSRKREYADYYDDASIRLVAERDRYVIERFGYEPPR